MPQWTPQQNNAITASGRNILVSAAAGSGKTAVLVERVKRLITDLSIPAGIDNLLIVTFTNAAAAEIKSRISKALKESINANPEIDYYKKQLSMLPSAKICTIDAFCTNLVRENFYALSINQDFTILDESELLLIEDSVISEVLDDFFEKSDKNFISLIEAFTSPDNEKPFFDAVKKLLRFIYSQPFAYKWLDDAIEYYNPKTPLSKTIWFKYVDEQVKYLFELGTSLVNKNISLVNFADEKLNQKFIDVFNDDLTEYSRFYNAYKKSIKDVHNERKAEFIRFPTAKSADKSIIAELKANRDIYKKLLTEDIMQFLSDDDADYADDAKMLYSQLNTLKAFVKEVDKRLMKEKRDRNSFSFSDIEHFAISLLFEPDDDGIIKKTPLADSLSAGFYEILVDEYQDTNEAQDLIFTYLSNGKNMFTVGDIKQSIYRFRLAMPHIFNEKKKKCLPYNADDNSRNSKIILDKNFRSRNEICSYVNFVFSNLMSERLGELDYSEEEYLNCGANYRDSNVSSAGIYILENVKGGDSDTMEAMLIADTINKKVKSRELIKDGDTYRPVRYGDFVILMRSLKNHIGNYSKVFSDMAVPVICDNSTNLFENSEIKMILSLLRIIDNPMQDIPLIAAMISPFYSFSEEELARIRLDKQSGSFYSCVFSSKNEKVIAFKKDISLLRDISVTMSVSSFIRYIVDERGMLSFVNAMGNAEQRYQNIIKLISFAESFDSGINVGLTAFIRYIDKISASDKSVDSASLNSGYDNAVTIMSVHHSKGLEFPICILAGANRQYNKNDLNDRILLNSKLGLSVKCHNEKQLYQYKPLPYTVIRDKTITELMSENLRVLYVAMTRAKEQFLTFITCDKLESKIKRLSSIIIDSTVNPYLARKINCDADFFLLCALLHSDGQSLRELADKSIKFKNTNFRLDIVRTDEIFRFDGSETPDFAEPDENIIAMINDRISYKYERSELQCLSSKINASELDGIDLGFEYIASSKPAFMNKQGMSGAERGTAMHAFMQFCEYSSAKNNLENEINRLVLNGCISQEQADSLDRDRLAVFFRSEFAERIFSADKVYREIKVSSFINASEIYETDCNDKILVQGIADCVIEENGILTIIDYKTDRVSNADELLDRYKRQISFYKNAVSKTLGKEVGSSILYSFHLQKCCCYK